MSFASPSCAGPSTFQRKLDTHDLTGRSSVAKHIVNLTLTMGRPGKSRRSHRIGMDAATSLLHNKPGRHLAESETEMSRLITGARGKFDETSVQSRFLRLLGHSARLRPRPRP
ncbi:hypothetical protein BRAS3843_1070036 [Bradyrhizobium sp. STM 3843]|nr:hypothetical protein BRAS3843_1070036 [Bradyrhizobium sp. STM 3843]